MTNPKQLLTRNFLSKIASFSFFLFLFSTTFFQIANAMMYAPGATLEPDCAPGSPSCGVSTPAVTNIGNTNLTLSANRLLTLDGHTLTFDGTGANFVINDDGSLQFVPINFPSHSEGLLFYDTEDKALTYYNEVNGIHINIGEDSVVRVKNETGSTLLRGAAVYISGSNSTTPEVSLALADNFATSSVLGLVDQDINDGEYGYVITGGIIHNIDTSSFTPGDVIYLSATTPGAFTATLPAHPNNLVSLGYIAMQNGSTGQIYVSVKTAIRRIFTPGSVVFANAATGDLNFDNTNLFWNDTANRLGIGDNTPAKTFTIGNGTPGSNLFGVDGSNGNVTTQGDLTLSTSGGSISATDGGLTLIGAGASSLSTSAGELTLAAAGTGVTSTIQIGTGGVGSATPDLLALDVKSTTGDPAGFNGAMYYNEFGDRFRCYENSAWKDCDAGVVASYQTAYNNGGAVTTSGGNPIAFTLTSGNFTATGAGAVNLTPTSASSFTSGGALTLTGGAASTWSTSAGDLTLQAGSGIVSLGSSTNLSTNAALSINSGSSNITLQPAGSGSSAVVQIGVGGVGSTTPDVLALDVKSDAGDPSGAEGYMYYNTSTNKFRCYVGAAWSDCDTTGGTTTLQSAYGAVSGNTISTSGANIAFTLNTTDQFTATGAGAVNLTPTSASSFTSGGALTLTGGAASTWGTTTGDLVLGVNGSASGVVHIGADDTPSATPDLLSLDHKSVASGTGDPAGGDNGDMYYNDALDIFRCYEAGGWQDCGATVASAVTLQQAYVSNPVITTTSSNDLSFILTSGNFTATGAGAVNLTPTSASSFTSGGALTLTGGAASTWGTTSGALTLQAAGTGTTSVVQIGAGGAGSTTPDFLALDVKSSTGDPAGGAEGEMYYNTFDNKFRCYENSGWKDCDTAGTPTLQSVYNNGATITTASSTNVALVLTSGNFTASGAGSVLLTPTGASSFTSGGALTLTGGAASIWSTSAGALTLDSATALNLGTTNATSISIGKTGTVATINGSMTVPNYIDFTSSSNPTHAEGRVFYDSTEKSLAYYNDLSGTTVNLGQETRIRVYNNTGSTIPDGKAVYINGVFSGVPTVGLAKADSQTTARAIGITTTTIADGNYGDVNTAGTIHSIDTSLFSAGDHLYLSDATAGNFTITKPTTPSFAVPLGYVVKSDSTTGVIEVTSAAYLPGLVTTGAVTFGSSVGETQFDASNFFWDDTNNRLGIGDNTPAASLVVGSGDLFEVFGASGNVTTAGDITLGTGGGTIASAGGALTINSASATNLLLDSGTTGSILIGTGVAAKTITIGNATDDTFSLNSSGLNISSAGALSGITTINASGQITSTISTGTAPFVVASTTNVANLNASSLNGATFASPGAIGGGTAAAGTFTALTASASITDSGLTTNGVVTNTAAGLLGTLAGTTTTVLHGNAAGLPTFASVSGSDLASNITISTTGNISTTSTGTITSAGILTGSSDITVTGNWKGNVSTTSTSDSGTTSTISTKALAYYVASTDTTGNCSTGTKTFNITGLTDAEGSYAYIVSKAIDGGCNAGTLTLTVQINGVTISTVANANTNGTVTENYTVAYINGAWRILGTPSAADGADLAEMYATNDGSIEAGDVVSLDPSLVYGVKKSSSVNEKGVIGIVSTMPAMVIGETSSEGVTAIPVALSGRVPVKVNTENGAISSGDYLTASSTPGVAMKSNGSGPVIGQAMSLFDGSDSGVVIAFVKNFDLGNIDQTKILLGDVSKTDGLNTLVSTIQSEDAIDPVMIFGQKISDGQKFLTNFVSARVTAIRGYFDEVFAKKVHTEQICVKKSDDSEVCVGGDQLDALLNNTNLNYKPAPTPDPVPEIVPEVAQEATPEPAVSEINTEPLVESAPEPVPVPEQVSIPEPVSEPAPAE